MRKKVLILVKGSGLRATPFCRKAVLAALTIALAVTLFCACGKGAKDDYRLSVKDAAGNAVGFDEPPKRVVVLQASLASAWLLSGGELVGVTDDYDTYGLDVGAAEIIGTTKAPSIERIIALSPDLVVYSSKISAQLAAAETLSKANVKTFAAHIDGFDDYLFVLKQFCTLTERPDLYIQNGENVKTEIQSIKASVPENAAPSALFVRAYSAGMNIIGGGNIVCDMLAGLGVENIASGNGSTLVDLNELSMETVVQKNPQFIFIVYMGTSGNAATEQYLQNHLYSQEIWQNLTAVKEGRVNVLPSELFHYKPNDKWADSYRYLYEILYGEN